YCRWFSLESGRSVRLPTEVEWEYACRCGRRGLWCFGDDEQLLDEYAWTQRNSSNELHDAGTRKPSAWGLFDMHGSESEWCLLDSGEEPVNGVQAVVRGGAFNTPPEDTQSAARRLNPVDSPSHGAFRVLLELD
ncbi:MAG: SUMF1/EgtB/PvdO family nonheme iron enzyme, partial [Planctomycetaceae bacterium]|nr:SUMF1/EgtB/PvdO family nonheme iron enzyme [Planctomycetaceae bacterium]